ncbi:hypothetical protein B5F53_15380 [Blautia sp. An249]|uniref:hypothetical protein n=1 Tax=Blautia sp. An249 TaxID=1965603 RepID=UPI000B392696|nr:hypothetical protein [Blautia sp. An249]OUO76954.1 hypothetical protein B5F53_15380 [Blautia sp. An249]
MSRRIQQDFIDLISYFENYDLSTVLSEEKFKENAKCIHRKLYSFLVLSGELEYQRIFEGTHDAYKKYFNEIGSDLILAFFCWVSGAYKPAELQLRSSIENFIKTFIYNEDHTIISNKNVYEIFEIATNSNIFSPPICLKHLNSLKMQYSTLCAFVHSSSEKLFQNNALSLLPRYDNTLACEFCANFQGVLNSMLSISYYTFYDNIFHMHVENRELFLQGLLKKDKVEIYKNKLK